ncbi:hypothetical protein [Legionella maioricensis]|uniref:Uncharacterized protein n=1 Tax=Legionella maioricensis TaxID=2896528 RepID=A0A9X2CZF9_9GAMM|nr:hypothetical protein [Legionella maioricensis]MCL9683127.1 hypothetical protein [Legionella maioricensis]MCL9688026.1 hypothetical protein [Legionella maioricensis]
MWLMPISGDPSSRTPRDDGARLKSMAEELKKHLRRLEAPTPRPERLRNNAKTSSARMAQG